MVKVVQVGVGSFRLFFFDVLVLSIAIFSSLSFSLVFSERVWLGLDCFQIVFQLFCLDCFGFVWVIVGFAWLFLVVLVAWILCVVVMLCSGVEDCVRVCESVFLCVKSL